MSEVWKVMKGLAEVPRQELVSRLVEAEMALDAIRSGEVDAFIVSGSDGDKIYTLKDADHPYRLIIEEMNEGAITLEDGTILYSNRCFAGMMNCPLEKLMGSSIQDYLKQDDRERFAELLRGIEAGKGTRGEFSFIAGDSAICVQVAVNRIAFDGFAGYCLIVTDLTDLRRKEEALLKWSKIFEHAQWGIAIRHADTRTFEMVNPAFLRMYGYRAEELAQGTIINLLASPDAESEVATNMRLARENGRYVVESVHRRKDGSVFPVEVDLTAVKDAAGKEVLYYVMNVRDLTDSKKTEALKSEIQERKEREEVLSRSEQELKKLSAQLEQSNRDLEQFAYVAAHDLKSPLRIIKLYAELLQQKYKNPEVDSFITKIIENADDLDHMTSALLDYAKVQKSHKEFQKVDCQHVLKKALSNLSLDIKESGAEITQGNLGHVMGDNMLLVRLFQNLISNAVKYCPPERRPKIHIDCTPDNGDCLFSVRDNGAGVRARDKERIFELFRRGQTSTDGTGIGLTTCKKIVEIHGGRIWVESTRGKGSIFYFTLAKCIPSGN